MLRSLLFLALAAMAPLSAAAAPAATSPICQEIKEIPLISEINTDAPATEAKAAELETKVNKLKTDCASYKANPQQTGPLLTSLQESLRTIPPLSAAYKQAAEALLLKYASAMKGMNKLLELELKCPDEIRTAHRSVRARKLQLDTLAATTCDLSAARPPEEKFNQFGTKDTRAANASGVIQSEGMSQERVQAAILDPKGNRADSIALLRQADEYARSKGLPVASVGSRDTICGERCVALLRAQAAERTYGPSSPVFTNVYRQAESAKTGMWGHLFDPSLNIGI